MRIGDIDVPHSLIDAELRLGVLEKLLEQIINSNPNMVKPSTTQIDEFRKQTVSNLQKKYPNMGLELK